MSEKIYNKLQTKIVNWFYRHFVYKLVFTTKELETVIADIKTHHQEYIKCWYPELEDIPSQTEKNLKYYNKNYTDIIGQKNIDYILYPKEDLSFRRITVLRFEQYVVYSLLVRRIFHDLIKQEPKHLHQTRACEFVFSNKEIQEFQEFYPNYLSFNRRSRDLYYKGFTYLFEIDLKAFYDLINIDILLILLEQKKVDKKLLKALKKILSNTVFYNRGIPQGPSIPSKILAYIYLSYFDQKIIEKISKENKQIKFFRYSDDIRFMTKDLATFQWIKTTLYSYVYLLLRNIHLDINFSKTKWIEGANSVDDVIRTTISQLDEQLPNLKKVYREKNISNRILSPSRKKKYHNIIFSITYIPENNRIFHIKQIMSFAKRIDSFFFARDDSSSIEAVYKLLNRSVTKIYSKYKLLKMDKYLLKKLCRNVIENSRTQEYFLGYQWQLITKIYSMKNVINNEDITVKAEYFDLCRSSIRIIHQPETFRNSCINFQFGVLLFVRTHTEFDISKYKNNIAPIVLNRLNKENIDK